MGYRMYLGKIKKDLPILREEFCDVSECSYMEHSDEINTLFELGKYVEWRKENSPNLMGEDADTEMYKVDREFLLLLIKEYRKLNNKYFKDLKDKVETECNMDKIRLSKDAPENITIPFSLMVEFYNYFKNKEREWGERYNCLQLNDSSDGQITSSWKYEYSIFNLVHILHTFDWENDELLYYGY